MHYECPKCDYKKQIPPQKEKSFRNRCNLKNIRCPKCDHEHKFSPPNDAANTEQVAVAKINTNAPPPLNVVSDYRIKKTLGAMSVSYPCSACGSRLTSPLNNAGGIDHCPDCGTKFVVPGQAEYRQHQQQKATDAAGRIAAMSERAEVSKKAVINKAART